MKLSNIGSREDATEPGGFATPMTKKGVPYHFGMGGTTGEGHGA